MGAGSSTENQNQNKEIENPDEIFSIPDNQYTCPDCALIPQFVTMDYDLNEVHFKCKVHGLKKLPLKTYFINESKFLYFNCICAKCNTPQKKFNLMNEKERDQNTFSYCYECKKTFCPNCSKDHKHKKQLILVSKLNNKCNQHFDEAPFTTYCVTCHDHVCAHDDEEKHKEHYIEYIEKNHPSDDDINYILNKNNFIKQNIKLLDYIYKINNTILQTYYTSPNNYFYNANVINLKKSLEDNFSKFEELLKNLFDKLNNALRDNLRIINNRFNIKLSGNENKLDLSRKDITENEIELLVPIQFEDLHELNLSNNNITHIQVFENLHMPNLKILNLSYNKIENLSNLKSLSLKFHKLEILNLKSNFITDISILNEIDITNIKEKNDEENNDINFKSKQSKAVINKYGSKLKYFLSDEEKQKELISLFNERYKTSLTKDIIEINLNNKYINDDGFKILSQINFDSLQKLFLNFNNLVDINYLIKAKYPQLFVLDFSNNNIKNIKILNKVNISQLQILNLSANKISDISPFEYIKCEKLEELYLSCNSIKDISVLSKVRFSQLVKLYFSNNLINDIRIFEKAKMPLLEELYLNMNSISDINVLKKLNCPKMLKLFLSQNNISDISIFEKVQFTKLIKLDLSSNKISDIRVFEKVKFEDLQKLYLSQNNIEDISVLGKVPFNQLQDLYLNNNNINDISVFEKVKFYHLQGLYLTDNPINTSTEEVQGVIEKLKVIVKDLNI